MKIINSIKHNNRKGIVILYIILMIVFFLTSDIHVRADWLRENTIINDAMESVLNAGGTMAEAVVAAERARLEYLGKTPKGGWEEFERWAEEYIATTEFVEVVDEFGYSSYQPVKKKQEHKHNYTSTISKEATCSETGTMTYSCSCGKSYTEEISKTEHNYESDSIEKETCIKKRTEIFKCSVCGDSYAVEGDYGKHVYYPNKELTENAMCGKQIKVCSICGDTVELDLPEIVHSDPIEQIITEPSCTQNGKKKLFCSKCNDLLKIEVIPFTGHNKSNTSEVIKEATFTSSGLEQYKCLNCDMVMEEKEIPSSFYVFVSGTTGKVCICVSGITLIAIIITIFAVCRRKNKK